MEPHGPPRLHLVFLCLAIFITGVRPRFVTFIPNVSPTPEPAAASQDPESSAASPGLEPAAAPLHSHSTPDVSPTPKHAAAPRKQAKSPSLSPSKGISFESIGSVLANAPDKSAAAEEAAAMVQEIDVPSAKQAVNGLDVSAALNSVDEKTLKSLSSFI